ncbi:MAG: transcriptional repressor [Eubacterium sp.]|nr:transcriptional repressor [Eubacterium sp.]
MNYKTKQSELILEYIKQNADRHLTADEISDGLKSEVGKTTVYRNLERLCEQGVVRKYILSDGGSACYQYADCGQRTRHFHLKCLKCGRLLHLECDHLTEIDEHIKAEHGFTVDPSRTVFYGRCADCSEEVGG